MFPGLPISRLCALIHLSTPLTDEFTVSTRWAAAKGACASTGRRTQARAPTAAFNSSLHLDESSCLWNHTLKFTIPQRNSVLQTSHVSTITHQDLGGGKLCVNPCPVMHSYGYFSEVIYSFWRSSAKASVIKQLWTWSFSLHLKNRKGHKPGSKLSFLQASSTAGQVVLQHRKTLFLHLATFFSTSKWWNKK